MKFKQQKLAKECNKRKWLEIIKKAKTNPEVLESLHGCKVKWVAIEAIKINPQFYKHCSLSVKLNENVIHLVKTMNKKILEETDYSHLNTKHVKQIKCLIGYNGLALKRISMHKFSCDLIQNLIQLSIQENPMAFKYAWELRWKFGPSMNDTYRSWFVECWQREPLCVKFLSQIPFFSNEERMNFYHMSIEKNPFLVKYVPSHLLIQRPEWIKLLIDQKNFLFLDELDRHSNLISKTDVQKAFEINPESVFYMTPWLNRELIIPSILYDGFSIHLFQNQIPSLSLQEQLNFFEMAIFNLYNQHPFHFRYFNDEQFLWKNIFFEHGFAIKNSLVYQTVKKLSCKRNLTFALKRKIAIPDYKIDFINQRSILKLFNWDMLWDYNPQQVFSLLCICIKKHPPSFFNIPFSLLEKIPFFELIEQCKSALISFYGWYNWKIFIHSVKCLLIHIESFCFKWEGKLFHMIEFLKKDFYLQIKMYLTLESSFVYKNWFYHKDVCFIFY